jgi:uncharacterized protein (DUF302 family)
MFIHKCERLSLLKEVNFDIEIRGNMKKAIVIDHVCSELENNFDSFTFHLEKALGILRPATLHALGAAPASMVSYLNSTSDENNLMLFNILLQDDLQKKENRKKIKQYQVGNPKIMLRMIANHPGAGLYIPIHLLVYEKSNGKVVVEYDLPSSSFAQFNNSEILSDSITLENKLVRLVRIADEENREAILE